jgi:hypothetical protein
MSLVKRWLNELSGLAWTLAGTGLVLITLTGSTRRLGFIIAGIGLAINVIALLLQGDEE